MIVASSLGDCEECEAITDQVFSLCALLTIKSFRMIQGRSIAAKVSAMARQKLCKFVLKRSYSTKIDSDSMHLH